MLKWLRKAFTTSSNQSLNQSHMAGRMVAKSDTVLGEEIAHHIRDLGMPRDQAIAAAYSEEERGHKVAKNVTMATGLAHYDQVGVRHKPQDVSDIVKRATQRRS